MIPKCRGSPLIFPFSEISSTLSDSNKPGVAGGSLFCANAEPCMTGLCMKTIAPKNAVSNNILIRSNLKLAHTRRHVYAHHGHMKIRINSFLFQTTLVLFWIGSVRTQRTMVVISGCLFLAQNRPGIAPLLLLHKRTISCIKSAQSIPLSIYKSFIINTHSIWHFFPWIAGADIST